GRARSGKDRKRSAHALQRLREEAPLRPAGGPRLHQLSDHARMPGKVAGLVLARVAGVEALSLLARAFYQDLQLAPDGCFVLFQADPVLERDQAVQAVDLLSVRDLALPAVRRGPGTGTV